MKHETQSVSSGSARPESDRRLCREFVGSLVRLTEDIETRGDKHYARGSEWIVVQTYRGKFTVESPGQYGNPVERPRIRNLRRYQIVLSFEEAQMKQSKEVVR